MKEGFFRADFIPPEERNLHQFKGKTLKEAIEYFEDQNIYIEENSGKENWEQYKNREGQSIFDGFLDLLREKGVRVSTPEWIQFLQVIGKKTNTIELKKMLEEKELLNNIRMFAQTTLIKNKADEASFHEAFDEYFELPAKIYNKELEEQEEIKEKKDRDSKVEPQLKDKLGIQEVEENLFEDENHKDNEKVHGGKKDQHNDIFKKEDLSKQGGGDKKENINSEGNKKMLSEEKVEKTGVGKGENEKEGQGQGKGNKSKFYVDYTNKRQLSISGKGLETENQIEDNSKIIESSKNIQQEKKEYGYLVGGGKGKSVFAERVQQDFVYDGKKIDKQTIQDREKKVGKIDRRLRYEERPNKVSMREIVRNIRRIIIDISEVKSKNVDLKRTVENFSKRNFRFDYEKEREKQPEIVLFVDVGGPVDEWSPLVKEVVETMMDGLTKFEVYLFHNNLYGYVWKPDVKNLVSSNYAKPNSLIDIKSIIKKRKKVIIYGDAEMSYSEFEKDYWQPIGNDEKIKKFGMGGEECLNFIKKKSDSVVWISPVFKKEWDNHDNSGTINAVNKIIPMYDLTIGGMEDSIKDLIKE